jgi:hypothetical protein
MRDRTFLVRLLLGVIIVLCLGWCVRIGYRGYAVVKTLRALGVNAVRLQEVDTLLAPGSRVVWDSTTIATVRSRAMLRAANGTEHYDSAANSRWDALLSPILRDSARFGPQKGRPIQDVPGINDAVRILTGPNAAVLVTAEFVPGADTARVIREAAKGQLYATVDSAAAGAPVIVHLHSASPPDRAEPHGELVLAIPTVIVPVLPP